MNLTGDIEGILPDGLPKCQRDYWWFAPACRHSLPNCIPVVMGAVSFFYEAMQKAAAHGLPWALTLQKADFYDWLVGQGGGLAPRLPTQWNLPISAVDDVERRQIQFPPFNEVDFNNGIRLGNFERRIFYKLVQAPDAAQWDLQ